MPFFKPRAVVSALILALCLAVSGGCVAGKDKAAPTAEQAGQPVQLAEAEQAQEQPLISQERLNFLEKKTCP